jgi:hypothetical protein
VENNTFKANLRKIENIFGKREKKERKQGKLELSDRSQLKTEHKVHYHNSVFLSFSENSKFENN